MLRRDFGQLLGSAALLPMLPKATTLLAPPKSNEEKLLAWCAENGYECSYAYRQAPHISYYDNSIDPCLKFPVQWWFYLFIRNPHTLHMNIYMEGIPCRSWWLPNAKSMISDIGVDMLASYVLNECKFNQSGILTAYWICTRPSSKIHPEWAEENIGASLSTFDYDTYKFLWGIADLNRPGCVPYTPPVVAPSFTWSRDDAWPTWIYDQPDLKLLSRMSR